MTVIEAYKRLSLACPYDFGKYYGVNESSSVLGVGQIYSGIRYPVFMPGDNLFGTREGYVYILTHECDISQENIRPFNDLAIICPVVPFETLLKALSESMDNSRLVSFVQDLGKDSISRLSYLPPVEKQYLPHGGVLYLNQLAHTHVSSFDFSSAELVTSLTGYSLNILDIKITNHLLRPKSASLPLVRY